MRLTGKTIMEEFTNCPKCDHQTTDLSVSFCAVCGGKMLSSRKIRKMGWMAVVTGGLLVAMMVGIVLWVRFSDATWEGTAEMARYAITVGILIVALGTVGITGGVWMIKHGKRNKVLTYTMMALACMLAAIVVVHNLSEKT